MSKKCELCHRKPVASKHDDWCKECIEDHDHLVQSQYEDAMANGEPWALEDAPELWHPKYRKDE